jgi:endoglucanase
MVRKLVTALVLSCCVLSAKGTCTGSDSAAGCANFYTNTQSNAAIWVSRNLNDFRAEAINTHIAGVPAAKWFGGWVSNIGLSVNEYVSAAALQDKTPILVAYNIPNRDCGQYSAGGADSVNAYKTWISAFAAAIGNREAIVILEPDALPQIDCLKPQEQTNRYGLIRHAIMAFKTAAPKAWVYLDIGNSGWLAANEAGKRLLSVGVNETRGFSLNVSNFKTDDDSRNYGNSINQYLEKHGGFQKNFVVDTSRNGKGNIGNTWCDPAGRKIGTATRVNAAGYQPEMALWIKSPGNADGCAGTAGSFIPDIAFKMITGD